MSSKSPISDDMKTRRVSDDIRRKNAKSHSWEGVGSNSMPYRWVCIQCSLHKFTMTENQPDSVTYSCDEYTIMCIHNA